MKRVVEVQYPGIAPERQELDTDLSWVRRGAALAWMKGGEGPSDAAAITLSPHDDGVWVQVGPSEPQGMVHEGAQHREVLVAWGGEVYFNNIRLTFLQQNEAEGQPRPIFLVALLVALACGGFSIMGQLSTADASTREVAAPSLGKSGAPCPEQEPTAALDRAASAERAANGKEERFVFDSSDGLEALALLQQARTCYEVAAAAEAKQRAATELDRWSQRMNEYYTDLRLQLRVALDQHRVDDALKANRELGVLLADRPDDAYVKWLGEVRRELERKAARGH